MPQLGCVFARIEFEAQIVEWRGPAPFLFAPIPEKHVGEIRYAAKVASYGWGVVPVSASINDIEFTTSLFPRNGGYLLPVKVEVQKQADVTLGDVINAVIRIEVKDGTC